MVLSKKHVIVYLCLFIFFFLPVSAALAVDAQESFQEGVLASKQADYVAAVKAFEAALSAGIDTPALHYNLGVSYYRLGQYEKSKTSFLKLINDQSLSAISGYNLGLIAAKQGDDKLAIKYFREVSESTSDKSLLALSKTAIQRLDGIKKSGKGQRTKKKDRAWNGYVSLTAANDSNVGLVNDDLDTAGEVSDTSIGLLALTNGILSGTRKSGVEVLVLANLQRYQDQVVADDFDYSQYHFSVRKTGVAGRWETRMDIGLDNIDIGNRSFEKSYSASFRGKRYFSSRNYARLSYKLNVIDANDQFYNHLDGLKHKIKFDVTFPGKKDKYRFGLDMELNDRDDLSNPAAPVPAVLFRSYSATRLTLRGSYDYSFNKKWRLGLAGQYRNSRYSDEDVLLASATSTATRYTRVDNRFRLKAKLNYRIDRNFRLSLAVDYLDNDSNRKSFVNGTTTLGDTSIYNRNVVGLSLNWRF